MAVNVQTRNAKWARQTMVKSSVSVAVQTVGAICNLFSDFFYFEIFGIFYSTAKMIF